MFFLDGWAARRLVCLVALLAVRPACAAVDTLTFAQPDRVRMTALDLALHVSFAKHELAGSATLDLEWLAPDARELVLDTNHLKIRRIEATGADGRFKPVRSFRVDKAVPELGSALHIRLAEQSRRVRITYATSPDAAGLHHECASSCAITLRHEGRLRFLASTSATSPMARAAQSFHYSGIID